MDKFKINVVDLSKWMQTESLLYAKSKDGELRISCFGRFIVIRSEPKTTYSFNNIHDAVKKFNSIQN